MSEWLTEAYKAVEAELRQEEEMSSKNIVLQVSFSSHGSRSFSVLSARISAEAERAAIVVKAVALKEKHDL